MNREEVFSAWAPNSSIWSPWVAPVLFAQTDWDTRAQPEPAAPRPLPWPQSLTNDTAVIVDLQGDNSVEVGFALAAAGLRPVPLYNASPSPGLDAAQAVIDMRSIVDAIARITPALQRMMFSEHASPAFLLDSVRLSGTKPADQGMFDNRWMVFPQDFPSAAFLAAHGIQQALLLQKDRIDPQDDLAHCLLRWQEGGITIMSKSTDDDSPPCKISVKRPSKYKAVWYRALAQLGLRRSSAGGFGSYIPETSSAG